MIHLLLIGLPTGGERLVPANFGHKATGVDETVEFRQESKA